MLKMDNNSILQTNFNNELINPIELVILFLIIQEFLHDYNKFNDYIKGFSTQNERIARLEELVFEL
jgi:hypothetical protein